MVQSFGKFLQELSQNTGINFNIIAGEGKKIYTGDVCDTSSQRIYVPIHLGRSKATIDISKKYETCASILKYTIENKYRELFSMREQSLIDILDGKEITVDKINKNFPFLLKGSTLFLVKVDGSRYEALNIIKQLYNEQDVLCILYGDTIIVIGQFDEIIEHAKSIRESIVSDLYCRCYVSYANIIYDGQSIKRAYEDAKECMMLGRKFDIKGEVFDYNKMLFEKIVFNLAPRVKEELLQNFKEKFNIFDKEMVITIEEFVGCGLNISDAARKLYIHRNTLIYRLDKINKETGFDIRDFKEATVFIIAFLVWKESKR